MGGGWVSGYIYIRKADIYIYTKKPRYISAKKCVVPNQSIVPGGGGGKERKGG